MSSIQALSFDADGTLWNFDATMRRSLARSIDFLSERDERLTALTVAELVDVRQQIARRPSPVVQSIEELRFFAFEESLRRFGCTDADLVSEVTTFYLSERFADPILFDDARPALEFLATRFELALVSNGNSDPERCGLAGIFAITLFADQLRIAKPDPRIYAQLLDAIGHPGAEVVHVGDSLVNDVEAAARAGLATVWLNRFGQAPTAVRIQPDATIQTLSELPALMENWT